MKMRMKRTNRTSEQGFTLVELSIVLVIIGLIVGGVLVGQNMIKAAEIRATVSQIEKYNSAINTFRSKYGGIPGDFNKATNFGLGAADGDGDGLLEDADGAVVDFTGELTNFWVNLGNSNMIEGVYTVYGGADAGTAVSTHFPPSKHGRGGIITYGLNGFNHFHIGVTDSADDTIGFSDSLVQEDAYAIDLKMDDGASQTGSIRAASGTSAVTPAAAAADVCVEDGNNDYNLDDQYLSVACQLRLRMN